ncbi:hypothetical protein GTR04_7022 [Trichophyton interdigitale]|uniref:Uncharacterized protein n=1 Tax=Trichophyton interdigitale (strain MR816) TaxID=1215338 RepID=A0A059JC58_TRIIM|nr:hypothetical protein GY631_7040 [Trichophyton interdigitale]KAG5217094.1 hypothetical protein GY632_6900 [Trichophyton interdigitale]KAG8205597.1 hypothetical protein GTR04_7022 [Trichophyton interdigitale]KDB25228.1 hypothetical protein H109_02954 [Trichophyton interdigitale MR816]
MFGAGAELSLYCTQAAYAPAEQLSVRLSKLLWPQFSTVVLQHASPKPYLSSTDKKLSPCNLGFRPAKAWAFKPSAPTMASPSSRALTPLIFDIE